MTDLNSLRENLDEVDKQMVALFEKRMALSRHIAEYKKAQGLPVLDAGRESRVLDSRVQMLTDKSLSPSLRDFYVHLMALSRLEQARLWEEGENA